MVKRNILILSFFLILPPLAVGLTGRMITGDRGYALLLVFSLPLIPIVIGIYTRKSDPAEKWRRYFEIKGAMTKVERKQFKKLNWSIFLKSMCVFAFFGGAASIIILFNNLDSFWMFTVWYAWVPYLWRKQKALTRFLLSTEYARRHDLKAL